MKKILLSIIFIFICFASYAHIGHYSTYKKIEMEILRNNELIGYNYYFFSKKNDITLVTNQFKFEVNFRKTNKPFIPFKIIITNAVSKNWSIF